MANSEHVLSYPETGPSFVEIWDVSRQIAQDSPSGIGERVARTRSVRTGPRARETRGAGPAVSRSLLTSCAPSAVHQNASQTLVTVHQG